MHRGRTGRLSCGRPARGRIVAAYDRAVQRGANALVRLRAADGQVTVDCALDNAALHVDHKQRCVAGLAALSSGPRFRGCSRAVLEQGYAAAAAGDRSGLRPHDRRLSTLRHAVCNPPCVVETVLSAKPVPLQQEVVSVEHLRVSYGETLAVDDVSLSINARRDLRDPGTQRGRQDDHRRMHRWPAQG